VAASVRAIKCFRQIGEAHNIRLLHIMLNKDETRSRGSIRNAYTDESCQPKQELKGIEL
jgi:hypothetical protein